MSMHRNRSGAFTLIELLVVMAILALLVSLLMPVLTQAKAQARLVVCQANQRSASSAWLGFPEGHQGRFPAFAMSSVELGGGDPYHCPWPPVWMNLLNREYFHGNDRSFYPNSSSSSELWKDEPTCGPLLRFWDFWDTRSSPEYDNKWLSNGKYLCCPEYKAWGVDPGPYSNKWSRPWIGNNYVVGSHYDWNVEGFGGLVMPIEYAKSICRDYTYYSLGARMTWFGSPSTTYMMWEAEAGNDQNRYQSGVESPANSGKVLLNVSPNRTDMNKAEWTAGGGELAFRHLLPVNQALWQMKARAPALYVDGHVSVLNPNNDIYRNDYFVPN